MPVISIIKEYMAVRPSDEPTRDRKTSHPSTEYVVATRMQQLDIEQNEDLGQHFLIDEKAIQKIVAEATRYSTVIEIGPGVGQLTERLAQVAPKVIAIEIDERYAPVLAELEQQYPNLSIVYADALACGLEKRIRELQSQDEEVQIIANLPYHITEPFMKKVATLGISVSIMVGERFATAASRQNPSSPEYTALSLLTQSFFDVEVVAQVPREAFVPEPRTQSALLRLTPKSEGGAMVGKCDFIAQRLFLTANKSPLVKNVIKEALIAYSQATVKAGKSKAEVHRSLRRQVRQDLRRTVMIYNASRQLDEQEDEHQIMSQNQARQVIDQLSIPNTILEKPFSQLNNVEIRQLVLALSTLG